MSRSFWLDAGFWLCEGASVGSLLAAVTGRSGGATWGMWFLTAAFLFAYAEAVADDEDGQGPTAVA